MEHQINSVCSTVYIIIMSCILHQKVTRYIIMEIVITISIDLAFYDTLLYHG